VVFERFLGQIIEEESFWLEANPNLRNYLYNEIIPEKVLLKTLCQECLGPEKSTSFRIIET